MTGPRPLFACGVAAAVLSIATELAAGSLSSGYDFVRQSISDLAAVGAVTRPLVVPAEITDDLLLIAFAAGLWRVGGANRALRGTAAMVAANAVAGLGAELFPMQVGQAASDNTAGVALGATGSSRCSPPWPPARWRSRFDFERSRSRSSSHSPD